MSETKQIVIGTHNVQQLAEAMNKAIKAESDFVKFEGEEIPVPVVGEALTKIAMMLISEQIANSIIKEALKSEGYPEGATVH
jgi:hypothetical protein